MMLKYNLLLWLLSGIVSSVFGLGCRVNLFEDAIVTSPNYPNNYGSSRKCYTWLHAPEGQIIEITILAIELPNPNYSGFCRKDFVELHNGLDMDSSLIGPVLCGTGNVGVTFRTSGPQALIFFKSDRSIGTEKGFKFEVKMVDPPVISTPPTTTTVTTTTAPTTTRQPGDHVWFTGECGTSKYSDAGEFALSARIIGGTNARPGEFPWQFALVLPTGELTCGGSIVNERWVVTAAHCVYPDNKFFRVVVGAHNIEDLSETDRQTFSIDDLWIHDNYDPNTFNNDIALIKLSGSIVMSENVMPVCPPIALSTDHLHQKGVISGWGRSRDDSGSLFDPTTLLYTTVNITTRAYCQEEFDNLNASSPLTITENMICGSDNQGETNRDTCQGDSGGPLTIKQSDGTFVLAGITSWGVGCATGTPGVYTLVSRMMNWIQNTLDSNS